MITRQAQVTRRLSSESLESLGTEHPGVQDNAVVGLAPLGVVVLAQDLGLRIGNVKKDSRGSGAFANQLECANLRGKGILLDGESETVAGGLRIWKVAHHFDEISVELAMKRDGRACVVLRRFILQTKVVPETKRRPVRGPVAIERTVHALLGRQPLLQNHKA